MGSSRGVGLCFLLVLVFMCEASEDPQPLHRKMTDVYDEDDVQREMPFTPEELDMMLQRPIIPNLAKVLASDPSDVVISPEEDTNFHPEDIPKVNPVFGPRSMGPNAGPQIDFPPAFPNIGNFQDICEFSKASVRYPDDMFPSSGFGREHREGDAVNRLQGWYGVCCGLDGTQAEKMCCAEQAWKKTLSDFCEEEFSIKTVAYFCCQKKKKAKWTCFDKEASATSYHVPANDFKTGIPHKAQGFKYNPGSCKGSSTASHSAPRKQSEVLDISFPPGRPDSSNIALICAHRKIRPRYLSRCLPRTGYGWLARQSKAINVLEKEYNRCCTEKKGEQNCAEKKWKKMVDKFCKEEKKTKGKHFECCDKKKGGEQYSCFASAAPDPTYNLTDGVLTPPAGPPTLDSFCDTHTALQSMTGFPFSVDQMVERCCPLVLQERSACIQRELDSRLDHLCEMKELLKPHCCEPNIKNRAKCATKLLLRYMNKANKAKNSGRKKCPLIQQI